MLSVLFVNAVALAGGLFIGYQRAKEIYAKEALRILKLNIVCKVKIIGALKVVITEPMLTELKTEYEKYKDNPRAVFDFHGEPMLVSYAKYLIEFLEEDFKEIKKKN